MIYSTIQVILPFSDDYFFKIADFDVIIGGFVFLMDDFVLLLDGFVLNPGDLVLKLVVFVFKLGVFFLKFVNFFILIGMEEKPLDQTKPIMVRSRIVMAEETRYQRVSDLSELFVLSSGTSK